CRRWGVPDVTAKPWSTSRQSPSPPRGRYVQDPCAVHPCTPCKYTDLVMSLYVPAALRRHIRARFLDRCAYCLTAEALIAATFEIEHIIPRSAGGETIFDNLCLACPTCNRSE